MNSKYISFVRYLISAIFHQKFQPIAILRFFRDSLKTASEQFFNMYDPFFTVVNWEEIANARGTTIDLAPAGPEGMYLTYKNACLVCVVKWVAPRVILEIGTYLGRITRTLFLEQR